ncbi:MAG: hypothetical protein HZB10_03815 [Candidatus Yonathbacteria bacterium]|nr:hypothetical protein [Candidatus Yonathbacteria bacterium]
MDLQYFAEEVVIVVSVHPRESDAVAIILQILLEEERSKGRSVPDFSNDFLMDLACTRSKIPLRFQRKHFKFATLFLEEVATRWDEADEDPRDIEEFLYLLGQCFPEGDTVQ